jgi:hypothetical protein
VWDWSCLRAREESGRIRKETDDLHMYNNVTPCYNTL